MLKQFKWKVLLWVFGQVLVVGLCVGMGVVVWVSQGGVVGSLGIGVEQFEYVEEDVVKVGLDCLIQVDRMLLLFYLKFVFEQCQVGVVNLCVEVDVQGCFSDVCVFSVINLGVFDVVLIVVVCSWIYWLVMKNGKLVVGVVKILIIFVMDNSEDVQ